MTKQKELMSRELRDSLSKRTDVLEKVKHLLLLPGIEMMTSKQVAEYFGVTTDMLKQVYVYNRAEIDNDGVMMMKPCDFDKLADDDFRGNNELPLKNDENHPVYVRVKTGKRGSTSFLLEDGTIVEIQNAGVRCFSSRAILRIAMLLRDSEVAKEVRTQLLNVVEAVEPEQRVIEINNELDLGKAIGNAYMQGDMNALLSACMAYNKYLSRHIDALQDANDLLAKGISKWGFAKILNALIRSYGYVVLGGNYQMAWHIFFKEMYAVGIALKQRAPVNGSKTIVSRIRPEEEQTALRIAAAMCQRKNINIANVVNDINAESIDLPMIEVLPE